MLANGRLAPFPFPWLSSLPIWKFLYNIFCHHRQSLLPRSKTITPSVPFSGLAMQDLLLLSIEENGESLWAKPGRAGKSSGLGAVLCAKAAPKPGPNAGVSVLPMLGKLESSNTTLLSPPFPACKQYIKVVKTLESCCSLPTHADMLCLSTIGPEQRSFDSCKESHLT